MKTMKAVLSLTCCASLLLLSTSCETPTRTPPPTKTISCKLPILTLLAESAGRKEKGGIEISVDPVSYKAERGQHKTRTEVQPNFGEALLAPTNPSTGRAYPFVEDRVEPFLKTSPDRLAFLIKINNKLPRVFRGAGTVVQYNVAGKLYAVDQTGYGEMLAAIIPPRSELQLTVTGPSLDTLPDQGTIGLFFYDVVTAADAAGNVTEKQNFEWFFNYSTKLLEETGAAAITRGFLVPNQR
jgi:hypothetical protein